jgi:hypothetical protein
VETAYDERIDTGRQVPAERREGIALAFFWLAVLAYGFFVPSILSWNTESHLYTTFAIVDRHTLTIDAYQQGLGDKSYWNGHYYSDKAPGLAFLAVPVYAGLRLLVHVAPAHGYPLYKHRANYYYLTQGMAFLRYAITYLLVSLPSALLAVLLWLFLLRVSGRAGWSLLVAAAYAFGTIAYVFSIWYFSHQICAVLLFGAFLLLFYRVRHRQPDRRTLLAAALAGLLAGCSVISEYPTDAIVALLGLYLLAVARARGPTRRSREGCRTAIAFVAGMVPPGALDLVYNLLAFGKPFATGYLYVHSQAYHVHIHAGLLGLANPLSYGIQAPSLYSLWQITFGTYRGIFLLCPVLLLFFAGIFFMWQRRDLRAEWWLCLAIVLLYFLIDAARGPDTNGWSGGSSVASRHLVPMLPFMVVPIVFGLRDRIFRIVFVALAAVSMAIMFMTVSATYLFPYTDQNPLMNEVLPNFFHGKIEPNWVFVWRSALGLTGFASLLPFFAAVVCLVARICWLLRFQPHAAAPVGSTVAELEPS